LSLELKHILGNTPKENLKKPLVKIDYRSYYTRELEEMVKKDTIGTSISLDIPSTNNKWTFQG